MEGTFPWAWPCAIPSVFACMVNESMPWHNQVKEGERSWDKKMAPSNFIFIHLFYSSASLVNDIKAYSISPLLIRDGGCRWTKINHATKQIYVFQ